MNQTITGNELIAPASKQDRSVENGPNTGCDGGLTLTQYLMTHAKPPKIIFEPIIRNSYVRNRTGGHWEIPDFGTNEYYDMVDKLAQADSVYRIAFAENAITALNGSKVPNE